MSKVCESVDVIVRNLELNPKCQHGPTILFSLKNGKKYFSCAGVRSHDCFYLDFENFEEDKVQQYSSRLIDDAVDKATELGLSYSEVKSLPSNDRIYCHTCEVFIKSDKSHESHSIIKGIDDNILQEPSLFLSQLNNDKINAQYFFDDNTLDFICSMLKGLKISKIICIGAPRLHDYVRKRKLDLHSILLDIDDRFKAFNTSKDFIKYNMFNNHFFDGIDDEEKLKIFLKDDNSDRSQHCIFTDPPFAARTELLAFTIQMFKNLFNRINAHFKVLPVFWVFPYFNESHIRKVMPEMEMLDFKISYMNHQAYHEGFKGRKAGSPVRIFTNVQARLIKYPAGFTNYRFCSPCHRFVSISNIHCAVCKTCPSKNGSTYRHCADCIICVKPNYKHCSTCMRCVSELNHVCVTYQKFQECWLCTQRGHVEKNCVLMKKLKRRKDGACIVCKKSFHNLKNCPCKNKILKLDVCHELG